MSQFMSVYLTSFPFVHPQQDTPEYKEALAKVLSGDGLLPDNSITTILHYMYAAANKVLKLKDLVQALNQVLMVLQERKPESDELVTALKEVATLLPQTGMMIVGVIKEAAEDISLAIKKASICVAGAGGQGGQK